MKNIILIILSVCFLTSCAPKIYQTNNGKMISQKKLHRIAKKALREAQKNLSKEEVNLLNGVESYKVDTINVSGN